MCLWQLYDTAVELIEMKERKYGEIEALMKGKSTRETILSHGSSNLVNIHFSVRTIICEGGRYTRNIEKKNPYQSLQFLNEKDPGDDKMQQRITHRGLETPI